MFPYLLFTAVAGLSVGAGWVLHFWFHKLHYHYARSRRSGHAGRSTC